MITFNCNNCDTDGICVCNQIVDTKKEKALNTKWNDYGQPIKAFGSGSVDVPQSEAALKPEDKINHPSHYTKGGIEVIQFIDSWNLGFALGNCIKYITRAEHKHDSPKEDLLKARWYLQHEIEKRGFDSEKISEAATQIGVSLLRKENENLKMIIRELQTSIISAYSRNIYGR